LPWWTAATESFRRELGQMLRHYACVAQFGDIRFGSFFHHLSQKPGDTIQMLLSLDAPMNVAVRLV
jgi:hypothetical protein